MKDAEKAAVIRPYNLIKENGVQDEPVELIPRVQQKSPEAKLSKGLKVEADRYLDEFYQQLYALHPLDAKDKISCYYSVHATVDHIYRAVFSIKRVWNEDDKERLRWLLRELLCDNGFLHAETRDEKKSSSVLSFRENFVNRADYFDMTLLDRDQQIDYAMALGMRRRRGLSSWTGIYAKAQNAIVHPSSVNEASASGQIAKQIADLYRQTAKMLQRPATELLAHIRGILRTQKKLEEAVLANALKAPFTAEQLSAQFKEPVFEEFQNAGSVFDRIAHLYCESRKACLKEIRQMKTKTSSVAQYEMYQQRRDVDFEPFLKQGNWAAYRKELLQLAEDTRGRKREASANMKNDVEDASADVSDVFFTIVEKYYKEWYRICRGKTYQKPKSFGEGLRLVHAFALGSLLHLEADGLEMHPVPLIVYALLVSPRDLRSAHVNLSVLCQQRPLSDFSRLPELQLRQISFFYDLMEYFGDGLSVDPQPWLVDFIEMTECPPTMAVAKNRNDAASFELIGLAFRNSMQERFSSVPIRGPVRSTAIDYQGVFQRMEKHTDQILCGNSSGNDGNGVPGARSVVQQSIENHSEWVGKYRALWSAPRHKCDYTDFLTKCISDDGDLQDLCRKVELARYSQETAPFQKLKPHRFIQCMLEDELRKKNIQITCKKMEELTLAVFRP